MEALLDDAPLPHNAPLPCKPGRSSAWVPSPGQASAAISPLRAGFAAPEYLGSTATFTLGGFGGHTGGALKAGDTLRLAHAPTPAPSVPDFAALTHEWEIDVRYGPHGAPDFFLERDIETIFSSTYEVHHNSARTGVRLIGPKPAWARADGGEAGLHPSNIHDNAYAVGAIDFTGDMPILLGPDGPSLGGFVCPAVITQI